VRARRRGGELRAADVAVEDGPEPDRPNVTVRRARRVDPLLCLRRLGTIDDRAFDAAERLREFIERSEAGVGGGSWGGSDVRLPAHQRSGLTDRMLGARAGVRTALAKIEASCRPVVLWVVLGGTLDAYEKFVHMRKGRAAEQLAVGLGQLADHLLGALDADRDRAPRIRAAELA